MRHQATACRRRAGQRVLARPGRRETAPGFSLVEVMVAMTLLVIAIVGVGTLLIAGRRSSARSWEDSVTGHRLRFWAETVRGTPFSEIVATHQGRHFVDAEVNLDIEVTILTNETDRSSIAGEFGLPRDLDGDGVATTTDISGSYLLLPVRLVATDTRDGSQVAVHRFFLSPDE